jgi:hypothetical protein
MKFFFFIALILLSGTIFGQFSNTHTQSNANTLEDFNGGVRARKGVVNGRYADTLTANNDNKIKWWPGAQIVTGNIVWLRDSTGTKWIMAGGGLLLKHGGAISSLPTIGFAPDTLDIVQWIDTVFYRSQGPTASLTASEVLELQASAALNRTLNYSSGRQFSTNTLATIIVAGISETFSQPAQSGTVSGTQGVSFPANTNTSFNNVTTTTDGQTATATVTFQFLPKRYWGWISDTTNIGNALFNDAGITGLNSEISSSNAKNFSTGDPSGVQFLVYAYYSVYGDLTHFDMNGFPSIDAMNKVTRNFTNALGFTGSWTIYWSKNGQTLSSTVIAN